AVGRMPGELHSELVVTKADTVAVAQGREVVVLVKTSIIGEEQEALFGNQIVQLELSEFEVEPGAVGQVIEANERVFEMETGRVVRRRKQGKRDVLIERTGGPEVHAGKIETVHLHGLTHQSACAGSAGDGIHGLVGGVLQVP